MVFLSVLMETWQEGGTSFTDEDTEVWREA